MAIRLSDAATVLVAGDGGLRRALANCAVTFYTGTQPTTANDSVGSSQPIIAFTNADAQHVVSVRPIWTVTFSAYTSNATCTVDAVTVGGYNILGGQLGVATLGATVTTLTDAIALAINNNVYNADFYATSGGATGVLTVYGPIASGAFFDSADLTVTKTNGGGALTATVGAKTGGTTGSGGLTFDPPVVNADGLSFDLVKPSTQIWKGKNGFGPATAATTAVFTGITTGTTYTAGWARVTCSVGDDGLSATSGATGYIRVDLSVGTSGTDFVMTPAATFTVNTTSGSEIETTLNSFRLRIKKAMA
jgi:hypothetical protein